MRRLVVLLLGLLTLTSCITKDSLSLPIGPVEVRVDQRGKVELFVGAQFATPLGDFRAGAAIDVIDALDGPEKWYVIVRRTDARGDRREVAYELDTDRGLRVESGGRLIEEFSQHRVLIDIPAGEERRITITPIEEDEVTTSEGEVVLLPKRYLGTWIGRMRGGNHHVWANAPHEYKSDTSIRLTLFGGEVGQPVGKFVYERWDCSGLVMFADLDEPGESSNDSREQVDLDMTILRNHGVEATCGGFTKNTEGGEPNLELTLRPDGRLHVVTSNRRTPQGKEIAEQITTILKRQR